MFILTIKVDGEDGAFSVMDDDGEEMLYLFEEKMMLLDLRYDARRKTMFLLMLWK